MTTITLPRRADRYAAHTHGTLEDGGPRRPAGRPATAFPATAPREVAPSHAFAVSTVSEPGTAAVDGAVSPSGELDADRRETGDGQPGGAGRSA